MNYRVTFIGFLGECLVHLELDSFAGEIEVYEC
jgi:hypothetical protein